MIRAFVAVPLPEEVVRELTGAQAGLPAGRPVAPENLHITVAFLGEHPEPLIEDVHYPLDTIRAPAFELTLDGLGLFGGDRPRSLHAEVTPEPMLTHLREKVLQAARGVGLRMDRTRFNPHVTLARFGKGLNGEDAEKIRSFTVRRMAFRAGPFAVEAFVLNRSTLGRKGPIYEELAAYPLSGGG